MTDSADHSDRLSPSLLSQWLSGANHPTMTTGCYRSAYHSDRLSPITKTDCYLLVDCDGWLVTINWSQCKIGADQRVFYLRRTREPFLFIPCALLLIINMSNCQGSFASTLTMIFIYLWEISQQSSLRYLFIYFLLKILVTHFFFHWTTSFLNLNTE